MQYLQADFALPCLLLTIYTFVTKEYGMSTIGVMHVRCLHILTLDLLSKKFLMAQSLWHLTFNPQSALDLSRSHLPTEN